jgi:hypothetical protein
MIARKLKSTLKKLPVGVLFLEVFSVVFAVLMALALDDWQENRTKLTLAENLTYKVIKEIRLNKSELASIIIKNDRERSELDKLLKEVNRLSGGDLMMGISFPKIKSTAWKSVVLTNSVSYMDIDLVGELSDIYYLQELYIDYATHLIKTHGTVWALSDADWKRQVKQRKSNLSSLIELGAELEKSYQLFLQNRKAGA